MLYRLSKYDFNDDLLSQWTSIWDITSPKYNISMKDYLYWENMHIECVKDIVDLTEDVSFNIKKFEYYGDIFKEKKERGLNVTESMIYDMICEDRKTPVFMALINGKRSFEKGKINDLVRFLLREEVWYKIVGKTIRIDIGYDYYIHLYCNINIPNNLIKKYSKLNFEYYDEKNKKFLNCN